MKQKMLNIKEVVKLQGWLEEHRITADEIIECINYIAGKSPVKNAGYKNKEEKLRKLSAVMYEVSHRQPGGAACMTAEDRAGYNMLKTTMICSGMV